MDESWYSARCLFELLAPEGDIRPRRVYEERIVLFRAASFDHALQQAEAEAREYVAETGHRYLECVDVFLMTDDQLANGSELYSLFRNGDPEPDDFVANFTSDFWDGDFQSNSSERPLTDPRSS